MSRPDWFKRDPVNRPSRMAEDSIQKLEAWERGRKEKPMFTPFGKLVIFLLTLVAGSFAILTAAFQCAARFRVHAILTAIGIAAMAGCSSAKVTSADLERFTYDLAAVTSVVGAIDRNKVDPSVAHRLDDVEAGLRSGVKASDLMTRLAKANGD